jgi:hypothetical protein
VESGGWGLPRTVAGRVEAALQVIEDALSAQPDMRVTGVCREPGLGLGSCSCVDSGGRGLPWSVAGSFEAALQVIQDALRARPDMRVTGGAMVTLWAVVASCSVVTCAVCCEVILEPAQPH